MSEQRALAAVERPAQVAEVRQARSAQAWNPEQVAVIKQLVCPGATDQELTLFAEVCRKTGLDPFSRQIYGIKRRSRDGDKLTIQTSIDGFRLIAERTGHYGGQLGPEWCGQDGVWTNVWLKNEAPAAARVGVIRTDWREPLWAVALTREYKQQSPMWDRMAVNMIAKCAESLALRRAFPAELSGLYTDSEMAQADEPEVAAPAAPRPRPQPEPEPRRPQQSRPQAARPAPEPAQAQEREELPLNWILRLEELAEALPVIESDRLAPADLKQVRMEVMRHVVRRVSGEDSRKYLTKEQAQQVANDLTALKARLENDGSGIDPTPIVGERRIDPETGEVVGGGRLPLVDAEPVEGEPGRDRYTG